ncbi:MAG: hypothetical protein E6Q89_07090 [Bacteroidia bacterium]|nr:MAG: hypothetical protein E6Q89_07090 [Bacteroidia bacterium]
MTQHKSSGIHFKHIKSQKDIAVERMKLKMELKYHKEALNNSFMDFRDELNPITNVLGTVKKVANSDTDHPLIGMGMAFVSDKLVKNVFLKDAGWFKKLIIPVLVKKISTYSVAHLKSERLAETLHKVANILRK